MPPRKKKGRNIPKWANCALRLNQSPGSHYRNGACNCDEPAKCCKNCCTTCELKDLKQPTAPTRPPNTPYKEKKRRRQREASDEANQRIDEMREATKTPAKEVGPTIMITSDDEANEIDAFTQTEAHEMTDVLRLAEYFKLPHMVRKYIPKRTDKIAIHTEKAALTKKETVRKLCIVGANVCENVFSIFSEYGEKLPAIVRRYVAKKSLNPCDIVSDDEEDFSGTLGVLFLEPGGDVLDDEEGKVHYRHFQQKSEFTNDEKEVKRERDRTAQACLSLMEGQKKTSAAFRTARAIFVYGMNKKDADKVLDKKTTHRAFGQESRKAAALDFEKATVHGIPLNPTPLSRERISDARVMYAVICMLDTENVGLWSWGEKVVTVKTHGGKGEQTVSLPKVFLRKSVQDNYQDYKFKLVNDPEAPPHQIGFTVYSQILARISSGDSEMLRAVDYVTSLLLHDSCNALLEIIKELVGQRDKTRCDELEEWLEVTRNFLKNQYTDHARKDDGVCTHGLAHGLGKPEPYADTFFDDNEPNSEDESGARQRQCKESTKNAEDEGSKMSDDEDSIMDLDDGCNACRFPFFFLHELRKETITQHKARTDRVKKAKANSPDNTIDKEFDKKLADAVNVINQVEEKFHLFMKHKQRVVNQQNELREIETTMRNEVKQSKGDGTQLMIVIDWKMKFENIVKLEGTHQHYGKRGISWHGVFGYFYRWNEEKDLAEKVVIKVDQILDTDTLQDGEAVLSMVECFLLCVEDNFPHLQTGIFQSDNAGCYHDKALVFGVAFLNQMPGRNIRIERIVHTETQDGKSLLDAHFARGTKQAVKYIKTCPSSENKQIGTPKELGMALAWNGGIQNACVQLVNVDRRGRLPELRACLDSCGLQAMEFFGRANEIRFVDEKNASKYAIWDPRSWDHFSFTIRVWAYSGVGEGALFVCDVGSSTFEQAESSDELELLGLDQVLVDDSGEDELANSSSKDDGQWRKEKPPRDWDPEEFDDDLNSDASDTDILADLTAAYEDDIEEAKSVKFGDAKELPSPPSEERYMPENTLTGARIIGMSIFGDIKAKDGKDKAKKKVAQEEDEDDARPSKAALPRALRLVDFLVANHCVKIKSGKDDSLDIYSRASTFSLDMTKYTMGWARRPLDGSGLYGESNMTVEYYNTIFEMVRKGEENKSDKMNPRQIYLELKARFKRFSVPSEQEIRTRITSMLEKIREKPKPPPKKTKAPPKKKKGELAPRLIPIRSKFVEAMQKKIRQTGWQDMKPKQVVDRLWKEKIKPCISENDFESMHAELRSKFSSLKSTKKLKQAKIRKRAIV
jgi:hypothetical protein